MGCRKRFKKKLTCLGDMNKRVDLLTVDDSTTNDAGDPIYVLGTTTTVWAFLRARSGNEVLNGLVRQQQVSHVMKTRYSQAYLQVKQVNYNDNGLARKFRVEAVFDPNEDRQELQFELEENGDLPLND